MAVFQHSPQLFQYSGDIVRLPVKNADVYRKQKLIERYGADIRLPDLREEIAKCERQGKKYDACMVHCVDFVPASLKGPPRW